MNSPQKTESALPLNWKKTLMAHFLFLTVALGLLSLVKPSIQVLDFLLGGALGMLNLGLITLSARHFFLKKSFALPMLASVFKYGILILLFWWIMNTEIKISIDFLLGLSVLIPGLAYFIWQLSKSAS